MSELLKRSIESLSVVSNVQTGLSHPNDEARAKELFKALHAEGELLTCGDVERLALANNWPQKHARKLGELAERIGGGGRVVVKHPKGWGEPTVARLKAEIKSGNA